MFEHTVRLCKCNALDFIEITMDLCGLYVFELFKMIVCVHTNAVYT